MTPPLPISVCLISGAEAARIGRALQSVNGLAAEIIVVLNQEVQDGTEEICQRLGAKIYREPWKGHIGQKNSAVQKATQPWILGLDADEALSEGLQNEIRSLFAEPTRLDGQSAFSFPRLTAFCGRWIRHGDWYPDRQIRLWRAGRAKWGGTDPHDKLLVEGAVGRLRGDLLHYSNPSITSYLQKYPYFADLYLQQQLARGEQWSAPAVIVRSVWRFFRGYLFRLGFLDGYPGFYIACSTAYGTLFRHTRLYEHLHGSEPPPPPRARR
ncbi:MAG TPA: glycosyltransferase family 2 protein [Verrucomicrobiota bacterium]|nr:glycosyltransferase family 2 protein [Verrucomicrobiales bacterium]HRI11912.1 glycosyltransferase family 2 protein [Verrucomicrobiota bacterium]